MARSARWRLAPRPDDEADDAAARRLRLEVVELPVAERGFVRPPRRASAS